MNASPSPALASLKQRMRRAFREVTDGHSDGTFIDIDDWWRSADILSALGPAMAELFPGVDPTVVVGPASSGYLLGPVVAREFGVGFVPVTKDPRSSVDSDPWRTMTTPPDYRDRHLRLGFRRRLIGAGDRVLAVDDLIDTGGQMFAVQGLIRDSEALWLGAAVLIDNLHSHADRRKLNLRSVFNMRDL